MSVKVPPNQRHEREQSDIDGSWYCWSCLADLDDPNADPYCSENTCRNEDCNEPLDNGEGYDGYCGNCADVAEGNEEWSHHD